MATLLVRGGTVYTPFDVISDGAVFARDGVIERVGPASELREAAGRVVDASGLIVCPGFVDLQVNGGGGALLTEQPTSEALETIAHAHVRFGTTSLLATVITSSEPAMAAALRAVAEAAGRPPAGARVLGVHLEGPFINPKRRGAHDERFIQQPDGGLFERLRAVAGGALRLVTLAPELAGAPDLIAVARAGGAAVALGHSDASYEEARVVFEAGASVATHLFNAMPSVHQRAPGLAGAAGDDVIVTLIADGVHVHPALLRLVARAKGARGVALITDAMPPAGTDAASFRLGGREVAVRGGACYLPDGTLAGSALTMDRAVRLMRDLAGVSLRECLEMATATPARALGLEREIGALTPGARADIVVCDEELNVRQVFVAGELAYARDE